MSIQKEVCQAMTSRQRRGLGRARRTKDSRGRGRVLLGGLPVWTLALLLAAAGLASAQFGAGPGQQWTTFDDPAGRFSLDVPPGWSYQAHLSTDTVFRFYGSGAYDLFYVQFMVPASGTAAPAAQAQDLVRRFSSGPEALPGFQVVSQPAPGTLGGKEASFVVYSFSGEGGITRVEGRAFVEHRGQVLTIAFSDEASLFSDKVPVFNAVLESVVLHEAAQAPLFGAGLGTGGTSAGQAAATGPVSVAFGPAATETAAAGVFTSPGGFYRFVVPEGWELWEEQASARGDAIEPWNGVQLWTGRPLTKTLFIWDYFDELEQKGQQLEIVLLVAENAPGTLDQSLETLKRNMAGEWSHIYQWETQRARIAGQNGVTGRLTVGSLYTEPWTLEDAWWKQFTAYAFKQGTTLFVWLIPAEVEYHPAVVEAVGSLEWLR